MCRIIVCAFSCLLSCAYAWGAVVFTVDSTLDAIDDDASDGICHTAANTCTLRAAVMQANRIPLGGATIMLPPGTYPLTRPPSLANGEDDGDLNFDVPPGYQAGPTTIIGAGAATTTIDGLGINRVLNLSSNRTVSISGVSLVNGVAHESDGGCIYSDGNLTLSETTIAGCNVTSNDYRISVLGGAIRADDYSQLSMIRVSVNGSHCDYSGGGISVGQFAVAILDRSTVAGNSAEYGGAISSLGSLTILNSTITANSALNYGGGLYNSGTANVYNSSVVFNQADPYLDTGGVGAGIYNSAVAVFNVRNSVVAGNYLGGTPDYNDCYGQLGIYGNNRFSNTADCSAAPGSTGTALFIGSVYELGILRDNGGPTPTVALIPPSALIDGGSGCVDQYGAPLTTDQRGRPRSLGERCDIGAFEYDPGDIFANGFQ